MLLSDTHTEQQKLRSSPCLCVATEVKQGDTLPSLGPRGVNKCPFHHLFCGTLFAFLCFRLVISLFNMARERTAYMLSSGLSTGRLLWALPTKHVC